MGVYLADQTISFLQALLVGALLGFLFDVFRISRIAIPTNKIIIFAEDLLYFFACAVISFALLMGTVEGKVRFFLLAGECLGAVLYFLTLGRMVMAVSKTIIQVIKSLLCFLFRWFLRPVWRLLYGILSLLLRPFYFLAGIIKKSMQRCKFSLKVRRLLLYNHFIVRLSAKRKKTGVPKTHEKSKKAS